MNPYIDPQSIEFHDRIESDIRGNYRSEADTAIYMTETLGWPAERSAAYLQSHRHIRNEKGIYALQWEGKHYFKIEMIETFVLREIRKQAEIRRGIQARMKIFGEI